MPALGQCQHPKEVQRGLGELLPNIGEHFTADHCCLPALVCCVLS